MKSRHVAMKVIFALLIFALFAVPQAFAQSDNACHTDNPLHNTYYANRDCTTDMEWNVGWCLHKVYNEGWGFAEHWYSLEDGSVTGDHFHWFDEYNAPLCDVMFASAAYDFDAQPKWLQENIDWVASRTPNRGRADFEIIRMRPDRYHNTRAAKWDAEGYGGQTNRKLLRLIPPHVELAHH